jgi:hypothetical protein
MNMKAPRVGNEPAVGDLGLVAEASVGSWRVAVDEMLAGTDRRFVEIDGPSAYLYFEVPSTSMVSEAIEHLESTVCRDERACQAYPQCDGVHLGTLLGHPLHLLRDDEYRERCFLVAGDSGETTLRISLCGSDFRDLLEALRHLQDERLQ